MKFLNMLSMCFFILVAACHTTDPENEEGVISLQVDVLDSEVEDAQTLDMQEDAQQPPTTEIPLTCETLHLQNLLGTCWRGNMRTLPGSTGYSHDTELCIDQEGKITIVYSITLRISCGYEGEIREEVYSPNECQQSCPQRSSIREVNRVQDLDMHTGTSCLPPSGELIIDRTSSDTLMAYWVSISCAPSMLIACSLTELSEACQEQDAPTAGILYRH